MQQDGKLGGAPQPPGHDHGSIASYAPSRDTNCEGCSLNTLNYTNNLRCFRCLIELIGTQGASTCNQIIWVYGTPSLLWLQASMCREDQNICAPTNTFQKKKQHITTFHIISHLKISEPYTYISSICFGIQQSKFEYAVRRRDFHDNKNAQP